MANSKLYKIGKTLLWVLFFMFVMHKLVSLVPQSWNFIIMGFSRLGLLIKWRPFIYMILNFIIISILISSSFTHKLNNLIQKIHKKSSHNISSLISQTSQKLLPPFDDNNDTWWSRIGHHEEKENYSPLDNNNETLLYNNDKENKTVSFEPRRSENLLEVKEVYHHEEIYTDEENKVEEQEDELDTMDDTWKAIMEAKNKGNGPHLKKSGTWTSGDRGEVKNGRLARYKVGLKKWSTFTREVVQRKNNPQHDVSGDGGGGGGGGSRGMESGLTFHDEFKERADAFIARVTHDMRLQRMESNQRALDRFNNRGVRSN